MSEKQPGIIVASFEPHENADHCFVVYGNCNPRRCFLVARRIFDVRPSAASSRAERERLARGAALFIDLDEVDIELKADEVVRMSKLTKTLETRVELEGNRKMIMTDCVLSPERPPRCYSDLFGFINVSAHVLAQMVPNVVYRGWIHVLVDTVRTAAGGSELQLVCTLDSLEDVQMGQTREFAGSAPWTDELEIERWSDEDLQEAVQTGVSSRVSRERNVKDHDAPISGEGFILDPASRTILHLGVSNERVVAAMLRGQSQAEFRAGAWVRFKMIYVRCTKQFVAHKVRKCTKAPDVVAEEKNGVLQFQFHVTKHAEYAHIYVDSRFQDMLIADRERYLRDRVLTEPVTVWAQYNAGGSCGKFEITHEGLDPVIVNPKTIESTALVLDEQGNCFCADVPTYCFLILGSHLRHECPAGSAITFVGVFKRDLQMCVIFTARPADGGPLTQLEPLRTSRGLLYKVTVKRPKDMDVLFAGPLGMIEDGRQLIPKKLGSSDVWVGFNNSPDRQSVFQVYDSREPTDEVASVPVLGTPIDANNDASAHDEYAALRAQATAIRDIVRQVLDDKEHVEKLQRAGLHARFLELTESPVYHI